MTNPQSAIRNPQRPLPAFSRRELLRRGGFGLGMLGLASLLADDGLLVSTAEAASETYANPMAPKAPHFPARAKHVIHFFANGGPSHVDTFDPKPSLAKYAGKPLPSENLRTERKTGAAFPSPFKFQKYGQSGIEVSELFPARGPQHRRHRRDPLDVRRRAQSRAVADADELRRVAAARAPASDRGSPIGLGTENQNLPGFIAMCPGGYRSRTPRTGNRRFCPACIRARTSTPSTTELEKLIENMRNGVLSRGQQRRQLDLVQELNRRHRQRRGEDAALDARIHSFELAYRMQIEASDAFDVQPASRSTSSTCTAPACKAGRLLIARRLIERGVRFVQLWHGARPALGQPRRHRGEPSPPGRASATRPSARCCWT